MVKAFSKNRKQMSLNISGNEQLVLIQNLLAQNKKLTSNNIDLTSKYKASEEKRILAEKENECLRQRQENLEFQLALLKEQLFGSKSEKTKKTEVDPEQQRLFDFPLDESVEDGDDEEEIIEVSGFTRKKKGRKPLPDNLPVKEIVIDISDEDKACTCGNEKNCIGEIVTERLEFIPQKICKLVIKRKKYACKKCEGIAEEGIKPTVIAAPAPQFLIPGGIATSSLLSQIFVSKYVDAIPFYRQEKQFSRFGDLVSRQSMSSWAMKAAESCTFLYERLKEHILSGPLINMDETTVQVVNEPGRKSTSKSYMWVMYGGPPGKKSVLFKYAPTRGSITARELLGEFSGCVQTDDYSGYNFLSSTEYSDRIVRLPCLAHIRRKFKDIEKVISSNKKKYKKTLSNVEWILRRIRKLYRQEKLFSQNGLSEDKLVTARKKKILPLIDKIEDKVNALLPGALPSSEFAAALGYASKLIPKLKTYVELPFATPDNNAAENLIRPFAIGRKNWMFMGNPRSAMASSILYSLVQTAILNKLNPWEYLRYIFDRLPYAETIREYESLLPWNLSENDIEAETDLSKRPVFKLL
jgi:transposase